MIYRLIKLILLPALVLMGFQGFATHLVGGSMSYKYIGRLSNGDIRYEITLRIYRDCAASTVQFDPEITIAAYNATNPGALRRTKTITKDSERPVDPPQGTDCPGAPLVCIREAIYTDYFDLPASSFGYNLVYKRCCRNTQNNIIDDMGQTYEVFIPPTNIVNSSPYFTGVPAPYICVNDTTTYLNSATDPDGDSLSYKLVWPWSGASAGDPNPHDDPQSTSGISSFYSTPADVIYRAGYNFNNPFGPSGLASVDVNNGLTTMLSPSKGRFALAIEVTEWRNGAKVSTVRLDVQMIVTDCKPNKNPNVGPGSGTLNKVVTAGETICFDIVASDADLDGNGVPYQTITLTAHGDILGENGWTGPKATFQKLSGKGTVTSKFCWTPTCDLARSYPYTIVAEAIDDGCPPKSRSVTFNIQVNQFIGERNVTGKPVVCENEETQYSVPFIAGYRYKWSVVGGTIKGIDSSNVITVQWGKAGAGRVRIIETSAQGCVGSPADLNILIVSKPGKKNIVGPDSVCEFSVNKLYSAISDAGSNFNWLVWGGNIVSFPASNQVLINWGGVGEGKVGMIETNSNGCPGDTNFLKVAITRSMLDTLYGSPSVCPHIRAVDYYVDGQPGANYQWSVVGGTLKTGNGTPHITVDWGGPGIGTVKVVETTKWGCIGDTVYYNVVINHVLIGTTPIGKDTVCEFSTNVRYDVIYTNGSKYFWSVTGGTIVKNDTTSWILVNWGATGAGNVTVYETSYDSVTHTPCIGAPTQLPVFISPLPAANEIKGPFVVCQESGDHNYTLNGYAGSSYIWRINGDSSKIKGQGTNTVTIDWKLDGAFILSVLEISKDSCIGTLVDSLVTVNKKPRTTPITGDSIVCFPNFAAHPYTVTGLPGSTFTWWIDNGTVTTGTGTNSIVVDWSGQQNNTMRVLEISDKGCLGDTLNYSVFADQPSIKMRYVSVGFPDDHMEIKWELSNAPKYNANFVVQRRIAGISDTWKNVGTVTGTTFTFTDKNLNTDDNAWEYRIKGVDLCGRDVYSDLHTNILLTGNKPDLYDVLINWTRYKGWTDGVRNYEVYRKNDFETDFSISRDKGSDTTDDYSDGLKTFAQRYRIKAYENNGNPDTTWSNEIIFNFEPVIWVPNAFTPNGDGLNNMYNVVTGSIKTFQIQIYDRWGELLFTANDPNFRWDGTFKGALCPDGVYIYHIRYSGADNIYKVLVGNITLLR